MIIKYQNEFGNLELETTDFVEVKTIHSKNIQSFIDLETAEKIALITDNEDTQVCFSFPDYKKAFVIYYQNNHIASVCKIKSLNYIGNTASEEIERIYQETKYLIL